MNQKPLMYIKPQCPWCIESMQFLDQHQLSYQTVNVLTEQGAMEAMQKLSGQTKVPTLNWQGNVLADFGVAELEPFLKKLKVI